MADKFFGLPDYVTVRLTGGSCERFLNLCRNKGVSLMDLRMCDECVECTLKRKQFKMLRPICHITGCRVRIIKKQGLRYLAFKYRKHYSFIIGIMLAVLFIRWINMYIWEITLNGNSLYTDLYFESYLESLGIETCVLKDSIDCDWLEMKIRQDFDGITWVSVAMSGSRLIISVKENEGAVTAEDSQTHSSIYAGDDGIIETIIVRSGTPLVKKGDTVTAGQMLVSGTITISDAYGVEMAVVETAADADIYISTTIEYCDRVDVNYRQKDYTGKVRATYIVDAYGKEITLFNQNTDDDWDMTSESINVRLFGKISLPIKVNIVKYNQYIISDKTYTEDEITEVLQERFNLYIKNLQNSVQILDNDVKITQEDGYYIMSGVINVIAPSVQYDSVSLDE